MDKETLRANLEALLFVSEEPQTAKRLAEATGDATPEQVQEMLDEMMRDYTAERFGIQLAEIAGGYPRALARCFAWLGYGVCGPPPYAETTLQRYFCGSK